jgi:hypothetical protein
MQRLFGEEKDRNDASMKSFSITYSRERILCPLNSKSKCELYQYRPLRCRTHGLPDNFIGFRLIKKTLSNLSQNLFLAFSGRFLEKGVLSFSMPDVVSGKFVQEYFHLLVYMSGNN